MLKKTKDKKIGFISLTRKYWKEQLFLYIIATLSCVMSNMIDNSIKETLFGIPVNAFSLIPEVSQQKEFDWPLLFWVSFVVLLYATVVFMHVFYAFHLQSKIRNHVKSQISEKLFQTSDYSNHDKELVASLLNNNVKSFSEYIFFIPNQLYYVILDVVLKGINLKSIGGSSTSSYIFFVQFFTALVFVCLALQLSFYVRELDLQKWLKREVESELFLVDNRDLIVKKGLVAENLKDYSSSLKNTLTSSNKRDVSQALSFVFPSYFMLKWYPFVALFLVGPSKLNWKKTLNSISAFKDIFDNVRKLIERGRQYPFSISSQEKINYFLTRDERDDLQHHALVSEKVDSIVFENVSFRYENTQKLILNNFNMNFSVGQINRLDFPNGFGKSTIISLLLGLATMQSGNVIINHKHKLSELDLHKWREKIVYSEHKNLVVQEHLSTGQKQLIDLEGSLSKQNADIYIFDEADSNLDPLNKERFLHEIEKLSQDKIVILVTHVALARGKEDTSNQG